MDIKAKIANSVFAKGKYTKLKFIIAIIISILIATIIVMINKNKILDRIPIFSVGIWFVLIHFIFKVKDIYEFIYKKRFIIAIIFMVYVVVMGYSGSSISVYNDIIQGEYKEEDFSTVLGTARSIRSDEWSLNTPVYTSQAVDEDNPYGYFNDNLRGTTTDMSSMVNAPVLDISLLGKPLNIGYIIFGPERGLSFLWYGKLTLLCLVSFEFCMLITKKKKLISLMGMLLITFSAATQWWYSTEIFIWGMLALVLIDKYMLSKDIKKKLLYAFGIFISGLSYIFIFYPAWQLSFGYIYLAVFIWICIKNRKEFKFKFKDFLIISIILLLIGLMVGRFFIKSSEALSLTMNTDYPGQRFEIGGGNYATKVVFSYLYSFLFPYKEAVNPCEYAGMISFFPVPIILAIIFIVKGIKNKNKKMLSFLIPMLLVSLLFTIWTFCQTNEFLAKITFLYMVPANRMAVPLGATQVLLLIYLMGNIGEKDVAIKNKKINIIMTLILNVFIVYFGQKTNQAFELSSTIFYICGLINLITIYQILNIDKEKNRNLLIGILIAMALVTGATVNPIQKGISVLNSKPIAKEIQNIVSTDNKNNLWIVDCTTFFIPNYVMANGARVINSTNIYPNFDLFKTVLEDEADKEEIRQIYNRYAHLNVEISTENKVELEFVDSIKLYLTTEKLKELTVNYIVSTRNNLQEFDTETIKYEQVYGEYGLFIYKLNY